MENNQEILFEINCPGNTRILSVIRRFICNIAQEMGFKEDEIAKIEISVDEACSNVICHAYDCAKEKGNVNTKQNPEPFKLKIILKADGNHIRISISDFGIGDKRGPHHGVSDLDEYLDQGHGLGTYIISQFMDKVEVHYPKQAGTTVTMVKFLQR